MPIYVCMYIQALEILTLLSNRHFAIAAYQQQLENAAYMMSPLMHPSNSNNGQGGGGNCSNHHEDIQRASSRRRKARTVFSDGQLEGLETRFEGQRYLSTPERIELAQRLSLSETQVCFFLNYL